MRGVPQMVPTLTTASGNAPLAVLATEVIRASVGELLRRALRHFAAPVVFVHHAPSGLTIATEDAATGAAISAIWHADGAGVLTLAPRPGQWGQVLLWEAVHDTFGGSLASQLGNDFQRRTAWGIVTAGLAVSNLAPPLPSVLVSQEAGTVSFKHADIESTLRALPVSGETVAVEWRADAPRLTFE